MSARDGRPVAERLAELEEIELTIDQLVTGGEGLGRFEGIPVFVPRSAPGDRLRVRLVERHPGYGRAEIVALLAPGPGRREPPCPHFARCGGCDLQHLDDALQVRLKVTAVAETLRRIGRLQVGTGQLEVVSGAAWGWRLRAQLHTAPAAEGSGSLVGYHARGTRDLVPIDRCPVLLPELEREAVTLARRLPAAGVPRRLDLAAGDGGEVAVAPLVEGLPHGELSVEVGEFRYRFDPRCFFQGHRGLLPQLVDRVVGSWEGERAYDLYGGVGLFALPLARRYREVVLVEGERLAARYARRNLREHRLAGQVVTQAVESWIGTGLPDAADRVVVDPPRPGLSTEVLALLRSRRPRRLTYVSCHPAALARDLASLAEVYDLERLVFLDLFPQTAHLEVVAQLVASDRAPVAVAPAPAPGRGSGRGPGGAAGNKWFDRRPGPGRGSPGPGRSGPGGGPGQGRDRSSGRGPVSGPGRGPAGGPSRGPSRGPAGGPGGRAGGGERRGPGGGSGGRPGEGPRPGPRPGPKPGPKPGPRPGPRPGPPRGPGRGPARGPGGGGRPPR